MCILYIKKLIRHNIQAQVSLRTGITSRSKTLKYAVTARLKFFFAYYDRRIQIYWV